MGGGRKVELREWEVVRFHRLGEGNELMVLLTPIGEEHRNRFEQWAKWKLVPRSTFGDHIVGARIKDDE